MNPRTRAALLALFGHSLFWGWNLLFLFVLTFGIGPTIGFGLLVATANGLIPWHMAGFLVVLVSLPLLGMALGAWKLRADPGRLLSLFYGVQAPLMVLCFVRLFAIQALTPATALALLVGAAGCLGLLRTLLAGFAERTAAGQVARQIAGTLALVLGLWGCALASLVVTPIALTVGSELAAAALRAPWELPLPSIDELRMLPLIALWVAFAATTAAMVLILPFATLGISIRAWQLVHRATRVRFGAAPAWGIAAGTIACLLVGFGLASRQPQAAAFAAIDAATTDAARARALGASELVRAGLLNARLAAVRHFDGDPFGREIAALWSRHLGASLAEAPRRAWVALTWPFVYHPAAPADASLPWDRATEVARALDAYGSFFDAPMSRAEREVLVRANRQTWDWQRAQAEMLEIGERKVHLDRQEITADVRGDHAVVSIHDVYRGQTWADEEVWLSFALADGAVPTGLWLGHTDDRAEAFRFVVAPRAAAQEVYEAEVKRRVDPALLEQVGPRNYRLRAYPVPAREGDPRDVWSLGSEGPELHLWLELVTPLAWERGSAHVPMPVVSEARNLYWDERTARSGAPVDTWVPAALPVAATPPRSRVVALEGFEVRADPARAEAASPAPRRVAVLVDGTRSMASQRDALEGALARVRAASDEMVVWCTVEQALRRCDGFEPRRALFWGAAALERRLVEAAPLARGMDALVVLTDAGSYELAAAAERAGLPEVRLPPLWLVHLGGMPAAYPDWTLDQLSRSGGGAVASVEELLAAWGDPAVAGGWRWSVSPSEAEGAAATDPFAKLAARQLVAHLDREARAHGLDTLDAMHRAAVNAEIVTPWSSMIVLVEQRQREALDAASRADDRFEREVAGAEEDDGQTVVSSAPEPSTWLLLLLGGGALASRRVHLLRSRGSLRASLATHPLRSRGSLRASLATGRGMGQVHP